MMTIDKNVGDYILLVFRFIQSLLLKISIYIRIHPLMSVNFITKRNILRNHKSNVSELRKHFGMD